MTLPKLIAIQSARNLCSYLLLYCSIFFQWREDQRSEISVSSTALLVPSFVNVDVMFHSSRESNPIKPNGGREKDAAIVWAPYWNE